MTDSRIGRGRHKTRAAHATSFDGSSATAGSFRDGNQQTAGSAISSQLHESVAAQLWLGRSRNKRQGNQAQASDDQYRIWRAPRKHASPSPGIAVLIAFPRSLQWSDT